MASQRAKKSARNQRDRERERLKRKQKERAEELRRHAKELGQTNQQGQQKARAALAKKVKPTPRAPARGRHIAAGAAADEHAAAAAATPGQDWRSSGGVRAAELRPLSCRWTCIDATHTIRGSTGEEVPVTVRFVHLSGADEGRTAVATAAEAELAIAAGVLVAANAGGPAPSATVVRLHVEPCSGFAERVLKKLRCAAGPAAAGNGEGGGRGGGEGARGDGRAGAAAGGSSAAAPAADPDITVVYEAAAPTAPAGAPQWSPKVAEAFFKQAMLDAAAAGAPPGWILPATFTATGTAAGAALVVAAALGKNGRVPKSWPHPSIDPRAWFGRAAAAAGTREPLQAAAVGIAANRRLHGRGYEVRSATHRGSSVGSGGSSGGGGGGGGGSRAGNYGAAGHRSGLGNAGLTCGPYHDKSADDPERRQFYSWLAAVGVAAYAAACATIGRAVMCAFEAAVATVAAVTGRADLASKLTLKALFEADGVLCDGELPAATMALSCNVDVAPHFDFNDACGTLIFWIAAHTQKIEELATFCLYSYGLAMPVTDGAHVLIRSDVVCHGTHGVNRALVPPSAQPTKNVPPGRPVLVGVGMYTRRNVIADAAVRALYFGPEWDANEFTGAAWPMAPRDGDADGGLLRAAITKQADACRRLAGLG